MRLSGITLPIIFLVLIPFFIAICYYIYGYYYFSGLLLTGHYFYVRIPMAFALVCYLAVIVYGAYPMVLRSERYFKKKRFASFVTEFEFMKNSFFVSLTVFIILTIADMYMTYSQISKLLVGHYLPFYDFIFAILASSVAVVIGALLRLAAQATKKEFRFYLAKAYCIVASNNDGGLDKTKYLIMSLDSYNKYLLRKIHFAIKNINKIYSDLIYIDANKKDDIIKSISESLDGDRLELAIYLSILYNVTPTEEFFIKELIMQRLRTIGVIAAAAVTSVAAAVPVLSKAISIIQPLFH